MWDASWKSSGSRSNSHDVKWSIKSGNYSSWAPTYRENAWPLPHSSEQLTKWRTKGTCHWKWWLTSWKQIKWPQGTHYRITTPTKWTKQRKRTTSWREGVKSWWEQRRAQTPVDNGRISKTWGEFWDKRVKSSKNISPLLWSISTNHRANSDRSHSSSWKMINPFNIQQLYYLKIIKINFSLVCHSQIHLHSEENFLLSSAG